MINARFGVLTSFRDTKQLMQFDFRQLGFPQYMYDIALKYNKYADIFPMFSPSGYTAIGNPGWRQIDRFPKTYQSIANITRVAGAHNLKIGGEYRRNELTYLQPNNPQGTFSFSRQTTSQDLITASNLEGNGFASMLLGWGSGGSIDHTPYSYSNDALWAGYIQDEWKVTRELTLNLGMRYELPIPRWEDQYRESYWNLDDSSRLNGKAPNMNLRGYMEFCTKDTPSPFNKDTNNFSPRFGFAYAVDDKTSIRAGYAYFYTLSRSVITGKPGQGFSSSSGVIFSRDNGLTQYAHLSDPWPDGFNLPPRDPWARVHTSGSVSERRRATPSALRTIASPSPFSGNCRVQTWSR